MLLILLLINIVLLFIFIKYSSNVVNRNIGEIIVRKYLEIYCKSRDAYVLNNITLRLKDGSTTQIDHVLITTKGIFVIETKHYKGWIFAKYQSKIWTQVIYKSRNTFQNPLLQNYKHVKAVQSALHFLNPKLIHNIVVFSGTAVFKTPKPFNVFYKKELIAVLERYSCGGISLIVVQDCIQSLNDMILEQTINTDIEHRKYLKQKFK